MSVFAAMIDPVVQSDEPHAPPYTPAAGSPAREQPPRVAPRLSPSGRFFDPDATQSDRNYTVVMHLSVLAAAVAPFLSLIIPIVMWQARRQESPFIDDHGREAVNFHLSLLLYGTVFTLLAVVLIGIPFLVAVFGLGIWGAIGSSIAAGRSEYYRYPMCLRFFK